MTWVGSGGLAGGHKELEELEVVAVVVEAVAVAAVSEDGKSFQWVFEGIKMMAGTIAVIMLSVQTGGN